MADDDLFAAFDDSDPESDDDLFGAFDDSGSDDPFADLDAGGDADDPFADLAEDDAVADPPPVESPAGQSASSPFDDMIEEEGGDERPAWLQELGGYDETFEPEDERQAQAQQQSGGGAGVLALLSQFRGAGPQGMAFGMTAQQRMVLAIFLFLDVSVLGCLILMAIGAVSF